MRAPLSPVVLALGALAAAALAACSVSSPPGAAPARPRKVVMGYYPAWAKASYDHTKIPFEHLTHIAHAFAWPSADGALVVPADLPYPELNAAARAAGVRMVLSVGGWGNCDGFAPMSASAAARARFVGQAVDYCRANAYDGIDLDWEFVDGDAEKADFSRLVEAIAAAFKAQSPPLLLTLAAPANNFHGRWIDFERLADDFDYIGFMTYDYHGAWSGHSGHNAPLYPWGADPCGSLDETFRYARGRRVPAGKILVGLAFFGRSFDGGGLGRAFTASAGWDYRDVAGLPAAEWTRVWDDQAQVPVKLRADGTMIICYDDPSSISLKCQYVRDQAAAGVMVWALGQDHRAGRSELLEVVGKSFGVR